MQLNLSFPSIPLNQIKGFSDTLHTILSGELKTDKALEFYFKQNGIKHPIEKKKIHDYCYQLLYWWIRIKNAFPNETKSTDKLIRFLNKSGKIKLEAVEDESILYAVPKEFLYALKSNWPENYKEILASLNQLPVIYVRVNTLLGYKKEQILNRLIEQGARAELVSESSNAIKIVNAFNLYGSDLFKEGAIEQQDLASQMVSDFLAPKPGDRVVDTCAGNGGKTLQIAALTENKGRILSLDIYPRKIEEMRKRLRKAGANNVEAKLIESQKTIKRLYNTFDKVLIDAPCTGSGVYRRNPDAKYYYKSTMLNTLVGEQMEILESYTKLAKVNGEIVFATCSVLKEEGENQILRFLSKNTNFILLEEKRLMPYDLDCDGFYMAKLKRIS